MLKSKTRKNISLKLENDENSKGIVFFNFSRLELHFLIILILEWNFTIFSNALGHKPDFFSYIRIITQFNRVDAPKMPHFACIALIGILVFYIAF